MIIAIDGPAGSGKTTTARCVANRLNFFHINTGAMYRAITLKISQENLDISNSVNLKNLLDETVLEIDKHGTSIFLDGKNVKREIVSKEINEKVSQISNIVIVREKLVEFQRKVSENRDVVLEGRDIGTVVFPLADFKFYLFADIETRAKRRQKELKKYGEYEEIDEIINTLNARDKRDLTRNNSPLKKAYDAIELDTTSLSIDEQVDFIISKVNK